MRSTIIIGNWKMNKSPKESRDFVRSLIQNLRTIPQNMVVGIAPTLLSFEGVLEEVKGTDVQVGAQVGHWEASGAFTGQVSMNMLKEAGASFCLIGHSEQRQMFCETNETANQRVKAALSIELTPVFCIGETLEAREAGRTNEVLATQIQEGLSGVQLNTGKDFILAYEPVWAIGTGKTATPEMAEEAHQFCRNELKSLFGDSISDQISIQYGGSAKPENAKVLLEQANIDGLLVGGASLQAESFYKIISST